jgi:hypothetical protein
MRALHLFLALMLTACTQIPAVDAAAPEQLGPLPDYLTAQERTAVEAFRAQSLPVLTDPQGDDLRARAEALRSR